MNKHFISALAVGFCSVSSAMAATVTYETRAINNPITVVPGFDYEAGWNSQSSTITSQSLADFNGSVVIPGGVKGGYSHLSVGFNLSTAANNWGFRLAPDAGLGGSIYLDGVLLSTKTDDLWWGGSWTLAEILVATGLNLSSGNHIFEGFWAEACCNGGQALQYTADNGNTWQSISGLANPTVPVPAAVWLFSSALLGLLAATRRKA